MTHLLPSPSEVAVGVTEDQADHQLRQRMARLRGQRLPSNQQSSPLAALCRSLSHLANQRRNLESLQNGQSRRAHFFAASPRSTNERMAVFDHRDVSIECPGFRPFSQSARPKSQRLRRLPLRWPRPPPFRTGSLRPCLARSRRAASVPRGELQRPHSTIVVSGACSGLATLIDMLPQASQTNLNF